jgi:hypothetical protein
LGALLGEHIRGVSRSASRHATCNVERDTRPMLAHLIFAGLGMLIGAAIVGAVVHWAR